MFKIFLYTFFLLTTTIYTSELPDEDWFRKHLYDRQEYLCYLEADKEWFACDLNNKDSLKKIFKRLLKSHNSIIIPVFPTVYSPGSNLTSDKPYFDTILNRAEIKENDKVLVVGSGTGADVWAAWLKSKTKVYALDINPIAVANTLATARIAKFPVNVIEADITKNELPSDFSDFDFVLWNMPVLNDPENHFNLSVPAEVFHDGDDGTILNQFLKRLPSLLKKKGKAIIWNTKKAADLVYYNKEIIPHGKFAVCIIQMTN